jgi:hypothetical protein
VSNVKQERAMVNQPVFYLSAGEIAHAAAVADA